VIAADTGFLYALFDPKDAWHQSATNMADTAVEEGWITTWPVITETCHLLARRLGVDYAGELLDDIADGGLLIYALPGDGAQRMASLMRRYVNLPMDLADASLVLLAEHLGHGRILSTDLRDFGAYRWKNRKPFKNLLALNA
jgi:uncharacterized protein